MDVFMSGISEIANGLISMAGREIGLLREYESELEKLRRTLDTIQAYLEDAEKRQVGDKVVRQWLKRLKRVAYDAEDILDEVEYETLRREIEIKRNWTDAFLPAIRWKAARRIQDVNDTLNELTKDMQAFNLNKGEGSKNASSETTSAAVNWRGTSSLIDSYQVVGRENDVKKIKEMLLGNGLNISHQADDGETVSVIPIVGFGGLGKTTLAQILYNDEEVKKAFEIRNWVSISNHSGDTTLLKIVAKAICGTDLSTKEQMLRSLATKLEEVKKENKNFLLILDDVWNEQCGNGGDTYFRDQWDDLKLALKHCVTSCRIIVTTRSINVARIMGTTVSPYHHLGVLSENDCWAIFEKWAFRSGGEQRSPALEKIGRDIVKKCGGVPLVAKTLGALLNSKQTPEAWLSIKDSETMINITSGDDSNIVRVLKLSYDHLTPPLRRCFSYCALFPKGYEIRKKELIRMWIAQGFLRSSNSNDIENVGNDYFDTLCGSCFFQDIQVKKSGGIKSCKMHDLLHDLAQSTSGKECLVVDSNANDLSETYHLWVDDMSKLNWEDKNLERLRTFVGEASVDLSKFKRLRVLVLRSESGIVTLPAAVGHLVHLRHLYINCSSHKTTFALFDKALHRHYLPALPTSICQLYKLQILHVKKCYQLKELPTDLWKLINLRHLIVGKRTKMPKGFGRLTDLRELPILAAGLWESGCEIEELEKLNHLRGGLQICGLENVRTVESAEKARLKEKKHVNILELSWDDKKDSVNYDEVLEAMPAPPSLLKMSMEGFPGGNLPKWLTNASVLTLLIELKLTKCDGCTEIPALWRHLPCLEVLLIDELRRVKLFGGYDQNEQATIYKRPRLKRLSLTKMDALEEWGEDIPDIEELTLEDCADLVITLATSIRSLKEIKIVRIRSVVVAKEEEEESTAAGYNNLTSLTSLLIVGVPDFRTLPKGFLQNNEHLQKVRITDCPTFQGFFAAHPVRRPSSLKSICISSCPSVIAVDLTGFTSLQTLELSECKNLKVIISTPLPSLEILRVGDIHGLVIKEAVGVSNLEEVTIVDCPCVMSLNIREWKSFHELKLLNCPGVKMTHFNGLTALPDLFGNLSSLTIFYCDKLTQFVSTTTTHPFSSLKTLWISRCNNLTQFISTLTTHPFPSLTTLEISHCYNLTQFVSTTTTNPFPSLQTFLIFYCDNLTQFASTTTTYPFPSLQILNISNCDNLTQFISTTATHPFPSLETLNIFHCDKLTQFVSTTTTHPFPSLTTLTISHCYNLTQFVSTTTTLLFPSLETLQISHCDKLTQVVSTTATHPFPSLKNLWLAYVCGTFVESAIKSLTFLRSLSAEGVPELTTLPVGFSPSIIELKSCPGFRVENGLQQMTSLRQLTIEDCQSVTSLGFMRGLVSLHSLTVLNCKGIGISSDEDLESPESLYKLELGGFVEELDYFPFPTFPMQCLEELKLKGWPKLMSLPQQLQHLTKLRQLKILNFDGLIALPDWIGKLSSLKILVIWSCKNLMHLPSKTDMQRLTSLRHLEIMNCPNLIKRCMAGGEERCKIPRQLLTMHENSFQLIFSDMLNYSC